MTLAALCLAACSFLVPAPAEAAGGGAPASGSFDLMVPIETLPITIIQQSQVKGILLVEFYLQAPDEALASRIDHMMPRLKDAFRTGLSEFAAHEIRMDRPVNLARLDGYIARETASVLHDRRARVIFRQVMVQKK